ncbi:hypothetical protein D3C78_1468270 [compost metagenome]
MGVAVDQGAHAAFGHDLRHHCRSDVDDLGGLLAGAHAAGIAQFAGELVAGGQRQVAQQPQREGIAQAFAQALVALVTGAQTVAVQ